MPDEITTEQPDTKQPPAGLKGAIAVNTQGLVMAANHEEIWRTVSLWHKSGLCPESFNRPEQVFFAHQTLASLGVNPLSWLRCCAYIKNSLTIFGDLPLALVNMSKKLECPPVEFLLDENYDRICVANKNLGAPVWAAVCQMRPAGASEAQERAYTVKMAEEAGKLPARAPSPWKLYMHRMLALKARGWLIKDLFPEVLNGVAQGEYDHDTLLDIKPTKRVEIIGKARPSVDLNDTYAEDA